MALIKVIIKTIPNRKTRAVFPFLSTMYAVFRFFRLFLSFPRSVSFLSSYMFSLRAKSVKCVIICKFSYTRLKVWIVRFILRHTVLLTEQLSTVRRSLSVDICLQSAHSSKPAALHCCGRRDRETDRWRTANTALHTMRTVSKLLAVSQKHYTVFKVIA